ncbi:Putative ribonuclease H protein At1g65750 [Linum grandiflorum]
MRVGDMVLAKYKPQRVDSFVGWTVRFDVEIIMNTDGSVIQPSRAAAGGGILQNSRGICQAAFAANYGICTITRAELRAALTGLHLAWDLGYRKVDLQVDSMTVVSLLQSQGETDHRHQACVQDLRQILDRNWIVHVTHTYREGNRVADLLAHHGHSLPFGVHSISSFSPALIDCIKADMIGVSFSRSIIIND